MKFFDSTMKIITSQVLCGLAITVAGPVTGVVLAAAAVGLAASAVIETRRNLKESEKKRSSQTPHRQPSQTRGHLRNRLRESVQEGEFRVVDNTHQAAKAAAPKAAVRVSPVAAKMMQGMGR